MQLPVQITFRNMGPSDAVEARVRERAEGLERYFPRIMACRVMIEAGGRQHHKGKIYHVRVQLTVPGNELVVQRDPPEHHAHEDIYVAIRDAFDAARRQLEDEARRLRGQEKVHAVPAHGRVARIFKDGGYGFIAGAEGEEIYMHRNSVVQGSFDALNVGDEVRYVVHTGEGEKGEQASTVVPLGKHHLPPEP